MNEPKPGLDLSPAQRKEIWAQVCETVESYYANVAELPVFPGTSQEKLKALLAPFNFETPISPKEALAFTTEGMRKHQLQTAHPCYFGVFNPCPSTMGIAAEMLTAAFNPQLASWTSSPFAIEIEQHVLRWWAAKFGMPAKSQGIFTQGGTEANHTALLTALTQRFPGFGTAGLRSLSAQPIIYVSSEAHHSFVKAARLCGLGTDAIREIPVGKDLSIPLNVLKEYVDSDRADGHVPFFLVATAGSTSAGVVDNLQALRYFAEEENLWFHVDAAWGGACALIPELKFLLQGMERADSVTLDAHKWLSVPMTAGLFLTSHEGILDETFRVEQSHYMPPSSNASYQHQPYHESMSWSRRFLGLKLFLSLAVAGESGYAETLRHQVRMGDELRKQLLKNEWKLMNSSLLPVVCFIDAHRGAPESARFLETFAKEVAATGRTWITTTRLGEDQPVLRAGIANYRTNETHIAELISVLNEVRKKLKAL